MIVSLAIALGLVFGSFLSMLIPRLHHGEAGIVKGRSQCPHCKSTLRSRELIPLLSYALQKGRCLSCKEPISFWYPLIELSTAASFLIVALHFQEPVPVALWCAQIWVLLYVFFSDLRYKEVHDAVLIPAIGAAFLFSLILGYWEQSLIGALIGLSFFGLQYLASRGRWLGSGDIFIGVYMGLILTWPLMLVALFLSYVLGSLFGIYLILSKKATKESALPLGPFLVLGSMLALAYGPSLIDFYLNIGL